LLLPKTSKTQAALALHQTELFTLACSSQISDDYQPVAWMGYPIHVPTLLVITHVA
jgi:hypothetical protein